MGLRYLAALCWLAATLSVLLPRPALSQGCTAPPQRGEAAVMLQPSNTLGLWDLVLIDTTRQGERMSSWAVRLWASDSLVWKRLLPPFALARIHRVAVGHAVRPPLVPDTSFHWDETSAALPVTVYDSLVRLGTPPGALDGNGYNLLVSDTSAHRLRGRWTHWSFGVPVGPPRPDPAGYFCAVPHDSK